MLFGHTGYRFVGLSDEIVRHLGEGGLWRMVVQWGVSRADLTAVREGMAVPADVGASTSASASGEDASRDSKRSR